MRAFVNNCAERLPADEVRELFALLRAQPHDVFLDGNLFPGHESPPSLFQSDRDSAAVLNGKVKLNKTLSLLTVF
jgi:hypothetical protein